MSPKFRYMAIDVVNMAEIDVSTILLLTKEFKQLGYIQDPKYITKNFVVYETDNSDLLEFFKSTLERKKIRQNLYKFYIKRPKNIKSLT